MKIVLVNHQDSGNINSFSGTSHFMSQAIKKEFEEVINYDNFETDEMAIRVYEGKFEETLKPVGERFSNFLKSNNVVADFILCQGGNSVIPFYDHHIPIAIWHDSTWSSFLKGYQNEEEFSRFKREYNNLYLWDKKALDRVDLVFFSSHYVAESCIKHYKVPNSKVKVVPFGANLFAAPSSGYLKEALSERLENKVINLTFIGKDWERKGLIKAYYLTEILNSLNIKTKLNVIGCSPDVDYLYKSPYVNMIGFINKNNGIENQRFQNVLSKTHFLVHPASAEPFGIVLCEANAYGIPILGTDIEGLKTIVLQGKNGYLFNSERFIQDSVAIIEKIVKNWDYEYPQLFTSALESFQQRLNWDTNTKIVRASLADFRSIKI